MPEKAEAPTSQKSLFSRMLCRFFLWRWGLAVLGMALAAGVYFLVIKYCGKPLFAYWPHKPDPSTSRIGFIQTSIAFRAV